MSWQTTLDADTLREIFERDIAPTLIIDGTIPLRPTLLLVGAQPGAGKSRAIGAVRSDHPDAVPVIGDDFRSFHPDYREMMRTDPLAMPGVTAQASGAWVGMSAAYLRQQRRSVILETTMRQHGVVAGTAAAFRDSGYRAEVRALAVPGAVSLLGTVSRFLGTGTGADRNRWTPSAAHAAAYSAMPDTIEQLVADSAVDRITVLTRSQQILYDRDGDAVRAGSAAGDARRAVDAGRSLSAMTHAEGSQWVREYMAAAATIARSRDASQDLRDTMTVLAGDAPAIIHAVYESTERPAVLKAVHTAAHRLSAPRAAFDTGPSTGPVISGSGGPGLS